MSNKPKNNLEIPEQLPLLPVRDMVVFPYMILPLYVGRGSSIKAVEKSLASHRLIFLASQVEMSEEDPSDQSIYKVGTVAMIMRMRKLSDGRVKILIQGVSKALIKSFHSQNPFFEVNIDKIEDAVDENLSSETKDLMSVCRQKLEKLINLGRLLSPDILLVLDDVKNPGRLADLIISNLGLSVKECQNILESQDHVERLKLVDAVLTKEILDFEKNPNKNSSQDSGQREYFLREQMRAIKGELGETPDPKASEIEDYKKKISDTLFPEDVQKEVVKQLARLERMHPDSSESSMIRNYLDWMVDLPWGIKTEDNIDIKEADQILNSDHYGLEKVKERILEYLAVRQLKSEAKGPILCFCGPPGVGKTSLGKSIAKAMGRKYERLALGGLKDEAEIRGHRRTYVGAMPGKIIQAVKNSGSNNPVIVLDEIDKLGSDFRGDPSSAMLEVLDPQQNKNFKDNYLSVDFDLSGVLFIATANVLDNIPPALRDRMELISISGYTENDKLLIAKAHLIKRQLEGNGLTPENIEFTNDGLETLISGYTREAGLRNLEREIGSVCRKVAKNVVLGLNDKTVVNRKKIFELMGPPRFIREEHLKVPKTGIVTGLAWTQAGGEILYIESIAIPGKGEFTVTGQLGDVMKESASAALSYAKSSVHKWGVNSNWFDNHHIHVHLPAGAIPKDGPSAGVALSTSLISLITGQNVRGDVAMTGEITLTGRVLPVGGIREKTLAALTQGINTVILPLQNKKDTEDIPKAFKKKINFIFVEHIDEVLQVALVKEDDMGHGLAA